MIINIGCGHKLRKDSINIDTTKYEGVDEVVDLSVYPWKWADGSIDGIHASHVIEHLPNQEQFIWECLRVLKKGGFLRLCLPHSSSVTAIGCMGHYRTYSYDTMNDYLSRDFYMFKTARFKTVEQKLRWWYELANGQGNLSKPMFYAIKFIDSIMTPLANISPRITENLFCPMIQMREVVWKGIKI